MKKVILFLTALIGFGSNSFAQTVKIGTQVWTTKNLDVSTFRNGDPIPEVQEYNEWLKAGKNKQPAWCYYNNDPKQGAKYGKLYNWYAVNDPRGLAPKGWHIPSEHEWTILIDYLGGKEVAATKMKSKSGWAENGNGNNNSGFSGLPGGSGAGSNFGLIGYYGYWWSSTLDTVTVPKGVPPYQAWYRTLFYNGKLVPNTPGFLYNGMSVRCIKD